MKKVILLSFLLLLYFSGSTQYNWSAVGAGNAYFNLWSTLAEIKTIGVHAGELYVGGYVDEIGGVVVDELAKWDGNNWSAVGTTCIECGIGGFVWGICSFNNELYIAGSFNISDGVDPDPWVVQHVARWDGTNWKGLGPKYLGKRGTNWISYTDPVEFNGKMYLGGEFTNSGGLSTNYVSAWDGSAFSQVGTGAGPGGCMVVDMEIYNSSLYIAGNFLTLAGTSTPCIGRMDAAGNFFSVGGGLNTTAIVNTMEVYNGELYVAGTNLTNAGGVSVNGITKWDGNNWLAVGGGITGDVWSLEVFNGKLFAGGSFMVPGNGIAFWDGNSWYETDPVGLNGGANALITFNGSLYVGGSFFSAGGVAGTQSIARLSTISTPIWLQSFTGKVLQDHSVLLRWTASNEKGKDVFIVERSADGKTFSEIAEVEGTGNSHEAQEYSYADNDAVEETNYYRLKYKEVSDEKFQYSPVVEVTFVTAKKFSISDFRPNPVSDKLGFILTSESNDTLYLEIKDMLGKTIKAINIEIKQGENYISVGTDGLCRGMYALKCSASQGAMIRKFLKQ